MPFQLGPAREYSSQLGLSELGLSQLGLLDAPPAPAPLYSLQLGRRRKGNQGARWPQYRGVQRPEWDTMAGDNQAETEGTVFFCVAETKRSGVTLTSGLRSS